MRSARLLLLVAVLTAALLGATATAATRHHKNNTKIFMLGPGKTRTYQVGYPDALKHGNARYSFSYRQLPPIHLLQGQTAPNLHKVRFLSAHNALGNSVVRVKVRNSNKAGTAPVRIWIRTTTTWRG